jgi:uncharacterized protein HemY
VKRIVSVVLVAAIFFGLSGIIWAEEKKPDDTRGLYSVYSQSLFQGKRLLRQGDFLWARMYFTKALESQQWPEALAFAATASYKTNDVEAAERYIANAEKQTGKGVFELRLAGYKALTYLKQGRQSEGIKALQEYTAMYNHLDPLMNIREVEAMAIKERIDLQRLEALLDEQITWREDELEQYEKTGTGFYGRYGGP